MPSNKKRSKRITPEERDEQLRMKKQYLMDQQHEETVLVPLLAKRSYYLPGNSWCQDWVSWMLNNHILLGICFHHPLHPIKWGKRIVAAIGSIAFGLSSTCIMYLWDVHDPERMQETLFFIPLISDSFVVTKGMIILWTIGGGCHSLFDMCVWYINACSCCHPGGCCYRERNKNRSTRDNDDDDNEKKTCRERMKHWGFYSILPVIAGLVGFMLLTVLIRASLESKADAENDEVDDGLNNADGDDAGDGTDSELSWKVPWRSVKFANMNVESFSFLMEYSILLGLSWIFYYPIGVTLIFSGMFGCNGKLPVLGGRPRDKARVERSLLRQNHSLIEMMPV